MFSFWEGVCGDEEVDCRGWGIGRWSCGCKYNLEYELKKLCGCVLRGSLVVAVLGLLCSL